MRRSGEEVYNCIKNAIITSTAKQKKSKKIFLFDDDYASLWEYINDHRHENNKKTYAGLFKIMVDGWNVLEGKPPVRSVRSNEEVFMSEKEIVFCISTWFSSIRLGK